MLPGRLTISTCIGCGAMGRAAQCAAGCSEHRLPLVAAGDFDALRAATEGARGGVKVLGPVARRLVDAAPPEQRCQEAWAALRVAARAALDAAGPGEDADGWGSPAVRVGWWCAQCGNVDAPQPCIGVCIWRDAEWVNADLYTAEYEHGAADLRGARALRELLRQVVAVAPRDGRCQDTWRAFAGRAGRALADGPA